MHVNIIGTQNIPFPYLLILIACLVLHIINIDCAVRAGVVLAEHGCVEGLGIDGGEQSIGSGIKGLASGVVASIDEVVSKAGRAPIRVDDAPRGIRGRCHGI